MATNTTNISLKKPAADENISVTDINANWDKIDTAFGAIGSGNNVKTLLTQESTAAKYKSTSSSTWDATVSGVAGIPGTLSADAKADLTALANAVDTLAASATNNTVTLHAVTATYTVPSSGSQTTAAAGVMLYRRTGATYYSAMVVPYSTTTPFYMRRNNTTRQIRVII